MGRDGEERKDFTVYASFATESSEFFRAALNRDWKEARERRVQLQESTVADFQLYLQCLYTDRMVALNHYDSGNSSMTLTRLYVLGDFLGDDRFCKNVIDALIGNSVLMNTGIVFSSAAVDFAWEKTASGSSLRKVLLELIMCNLGSVSFAPVFYGMGAWSKEVSVDVFRYMTEYPCVQAAVDAAVESLRQDPDVHGKSHRFDVLDSRGLGFLF